MDEVVEKTVNIQPISKGKRLLVYLGDFFLVFILTFVFFNALTVPAGNLITSYSEREKKSDEAAKNQFRVLYGEGVLLHENDGDLYSYNSNVAFTRNSYLSYYSFEDSDSLKNYPTYGHNETNEVIKHFFYDIRDDKSTYIFILRSFNAKYDYFDDYGDSFALKDNIKKDIRLSFFSPEDMSADGKTALSNLQSFFLEAYAEVFKTIEKYDLTHSDISYNKNKAIVNNLENIYQWQLSLLAIAAYLLAIALYFLLLPLFNENHRTLAMMMIKVTRIGTNNLYILGKTETLTNSIFMLAFNLPVMFFMPMTCVTFTYLFNLPVLLSLLFVGIVMIVVSFIFVMASPYNKTLCDFMSRSVVISNDDLDEIYRAKGYDI